MLEREKCTLYSGGLKGAEVAFGEAAEQWGIKEVTFSFAGHKIDRDRNTVVLNDQELRRGDISMELVSRMMGRNYYETEKIRKVLQAIFHMVNSGHQVFAVGTILEDNTVKGGTGWAVELAKLFNRPLSVYDQVRQGWYTWQNKVWEKGTPRISHPTFVGSGTRYITDDGVRAIRELFTESFGKP